MIKKHHKRVLVLNADFMPMGLISWRRAVVLSIVNQADPDKGVRVVDYYCNDFITSGGGQRHPIPSVVVVAKYVRNKRKRIPFSRKNVFIRDQMTCQYCGEQHLETEKLTYDHVIPRAQWNRKKYSGTPTNWTNIVTACIPCNRFKADRTPKEAAMQLLREPVEPSPHQFILGLSPWTRVPEEWVPYLTPIYKNILINKGDYDVTESPV